MKTFNNQHTNLIKRYLLSFCILLLFFASPSYADFINGGFEDTYIPSSSNTYNPITGWTLTSYLFNGSASTTPPSNITEINLTTGTTPGGITDIVHGPTQTIADWFLYGAVSNPNLLLPEAGLQSVMVNLRSIDAPLTVSGTSGKPVGWTTISKQATSISQQITVQASDIDPNDNVVHVRLKIAPVLENPSHGINQQPFFVVQLNNLTTGRTGATPLFYQWRYSAQPGVPWLTLASGAGTNSGSNTTYNYTNWQAYDIAPGNAFIHVGDVIELVVLASGCSLGGHDGHVYVDDVHTYIPPILWVNATGPQSTIPGSDITYTYTYVNAGDVAVNNVQVVANLPQQGNPSSLPAPSTTFVSVTTPTTGSCTSTGSTGPVTCSIGTLLPGQSGTFQLTVNVPNSWPISSGPVNNGNYPISGQDVNPLLGPLVQTNLQAPSNLSYLVADASNLPTTATIGVPYSGSFSCSNVPSSSATDTAPNASCDISNLPSGVNVTTCTISPSNTPWIQPADIPESQTVTCSVSGTPTTTGTVIATVTTDAANNADSTQNRVTATITVNGDNPSVSIPMTLNGSPIINPAVVCCGRPVLLGPLPTPGTGPTNYFVSSTIGNVTCLIGKTGTQTYLKVNGSNGSCTIVATKDGVTSEPFTVRAP